MSGGSALAGFMRRSMQLSGGSQMAVPVLWLDDRYKLCLRMGCISTATLRKWESAHQDLTRTARACSTSVSASTAVSATTAGAATAEASDSSATAISAATATVTVTATATATTTETVAVAEGTGVAVIPPTAGSSAGAAAPTDTFRLVARGKGRQVTVEAGVEAAVSAVLHAAQQLAALSEQQLLTVTQGARLAAQEVHNMVQQDLQQNAFTVLTCAAVRVDSTMGPQPQTLAARSERSSTCAGGAVLDIMAAAGEVGGTWVLLCSAPPAGCSLSATVAAAVHGLSAASSSSSTAFVADHTGKRLLVAAFCAAAVHERADSFLSLPTDRSASITFSESAPPRSRSAVLPLALDAMVLSSPRSESPLCRLSALRRLQQHCSCPRPMEALRRAHNATASGAATLLLVGAEELNTVVQATAGDEQMAQLLQYLAVQSMPLSVQHRHGNTQLHDAKHVSLRVVPDGAALIGLQRRRGAVNADGSVMTMAAGKAVTAAAYTTVDRSQRSRAVVKARRVAARQEREHARLKYAPLANLRSCTPQLLGQQLQYLQMAEAFAYEELTQNAADTAAADSEQHAAAAAAAAADVDEGE